MVRDTGEAEGQEFLINSKDCSVLGGISKAFFLLSYAILDFSKTSLITGYTQVKYRRHDQGERVWEECECM